MEFSRCASEDVQIGGADGHCLVMPSAPSAAKHFRVRAASGVLDDRSRRIAPSRHRLRVGRGGRFRAGRHRRTAASNLDSRPHRDSYAGQIADRPPPRRPPGVPPGGQSPSTSITSRLSCAPTTRCPGLGDHLGFKGGTPQQIPRRGRRHEPAPKAARFCLPRHSFRRAVSAIVACTVITVPLLD